jgi:hypothetical protein
MKHLFEHTTPLNTRPVDTPSVCAHHHSEDVDKDSG